MRGKSCDCRWHDSSRKGVKDASFFLTQSHKATKPRRRVLCFHRESTRDRLFSSASIPLHPLRIPSCLGVFVCDSTSLRRPQLHRNWCLSPGFQPGRMRWNHESTRIRIRVHSWFLQQNALKRGTGIERNQCRSGGC